MRYYYKLRRLYRKWQAIRHASLIMLINETSEMSGFILKDLTFAPTSDGGVVKHIHFIRQHQIVDAPIFRYRYGLPKTTKDTE